MVPLCAILPGIWHLLHLHRQDAAVQGIADQLGLGAQAELLHEMDAMGLHRAGTDAQGGRDLGIRPSLSGEVQDFALTRRKGLVQVQHPWRDSMTLDCNETFSQRSHERGTPGSDITDFLCEFADIVLFEDVSSRAMA